MRRRVIIVLVAVLVILASRFLATPSDPAPSNELTEAEIAQIKEEVETYYLEYEDAWEALDLERAVSMHLQTPEHTWAMNGTISRGPNRETAIAYYGSAQEVDWTSTDRHIAVLSQDAAVLLDVGTWRLVNSSGGIQESTYTYTYVIVRRDGEWKTLLGHGAFLDS